jgi:hypothetical protein
MELVSLLVSYANLVLCVLRTSLLIPSLNVIFCRPCAPPNNRKAEHSERVLSPSTLARIRFSILLCLRTQRRRKKCVCSVSVAVAADEGLFAFRFMKSVTLGREQPGLIRCKQARACDRGFVYECSVGFPNRVYSMLAFHRQTWSANKETFLSHYS